MGRNRKFVLEDDLQQAMWRTILRGPRPSAKWGRSSPANSKPGPVKQAQSGNVKKSEVKAPKQFGQSSTSPRVSRSPEEVMVATRSRVVKLRLVLAMLGDDDEASATIKAALQKAGPGARASRFRADQEHAVVYWSCRAGMSGIVALEALDKAVAIQQEQEAMLADGVKRLTELQEKERSLPSPFAVPTVPPSVQAESVIEGLQKELSAFRSGHAVH